jgi:hypothetical protein
MPPSTVTICGHSLSPQNRRFPSGELKHEVGRTPRSVSASRLVESLGRHSVECSKICIEQNLLAAKNDNRVCDPRGRISAMR